MEKLSLLLVGLLLLPCFPTYASKNMVKVHGRVTDFRGTPLEGADVYFGDYVDVMENGKLIHNKMKKNFPTITDRDGKFEVEIENRTYDAVFISKNYKDNPTDYLEFWFWNYNPKLTTSFDVFIDGLEAYGLSTWADKGANANIVYVRPMSLIKGLPYRLDKDHPIVDNHIPIAPELRKEDVEVTVDGVVQPIWGITKARETAGPNGLTVDAYLISVPEIKPNQNRVLCLKMHDSQNDERGMGCLGLQ